MAKPNSLAARRLIFLGLVLFLLGLIAGFANPTFKNPRMGLSAHLEGVMNGMFLVIAGLIWAEIKLSSRLTAVAFWSLLYGTYANWLACILAGVFGTSRMTPIAGAGFTGEPHKEMLVSALFGSVGVTMLIAISLLIWGYRGTHSVSSGTFGKR